ncbi:MAG TPA: bifunctional folylpolyglutamate synthase/dihydrofolate synthase [Parvularcula sp.]|nr:bifunctional folylpolyglutamate synthase/dihydrofolate synthase [Parvularcula sp.]
MTKDRPLDPVAAVLEQVAVRRPALIDLGLSRVERTLDRLGAPHRRTPPVFHVAGTNGKGSTCAYVRAILEASGARVHAFTSPHLVRYAERITLAGAEIADAAFIAAIRRVDEAAGADDLTLFETITCAAFIAFAETPADYLVLEVGLGGRLDATNVIDRPLAAAVTPIALDHQNFLGDTLAAIAAEKAGIFRSAAPAVIGPQSAEAMAVFERAAARLRAPLFAFGSAWTSWTENGRLIYQDELGLSDLAPPRLIGAHQFMNAGLAVACVRAAGLSFTDEILSAGLQGARWPARLQRLKSGPLVKALGAGGELWLDGGHNPHAARALSLALADMEEKNSRPLILITGMQENKDIDGFFAAFSGLAASVLAVQADHSGARTPDDVAAAAARAGISAFSCGSLIEAAKRAAAAGPARVLICGSLYLAGEVLRDNA